MICAKSTDNSDVSKLSDLMSYDFKSSECDTPMIYSDDSFDSIYIAKQKNYLQRPVNHIEA